MTRAQRITLCKRLFEVAGDMSDIELAYDLGMPAAQVRECRKAAAEGKPIPVKRTRVVEGFVASRTEGTTPRDHGSATRARPGHGTTLC